MLGAGGTWRRCRLEAETRWSEGYQQEEDSVGSWREVGVDSVGFQVNLYGPDLHKRPRGTLSAAYTT